MSYVLGGANGESSAFEKTIQNSALEVLHENNGLVGYTNVVMPSQGNVYKVPHLGPISFGDFTEGGAEAVQDSAMFANEITATAHVAQTRFGKFIGWTAAYDLASSLGRELGGSFAEKVDAVVAGAFLGFKATTGNTNYTQAAGGDGVTRVKEVGAVELRTAANTDTILATVRDVVAAWRAARNPGRPVIVLSEVEETRLLGELTGGAVNSDLSALGNELLQNGFIRNLYGCTMVFSTLLSTSSRAVAGGAAETVKVGAAMGPMAITTVMVRGLDIMMGDVDGGLSTWITGTGYFGAGASDKSRGMAINIEQA